MYGPTEVTAVCVHHTFSPEDDVVVIGKPDPNTHGYIVDSSMQLVPVGAPGELLLSGPRLALGYANRPDLTAEKFIPNPCLVTFESQIPDDLKPHFQLAYRTGDLVRWRANGEIEFLGRIDRQVKVNGVRIELGEVEAVLGAADAVQAAVVSAVRDPKGKQKLVGYVTPGDVDTAAVLEHCRSRLVASMVPSVITAMESFPLLPNGKIDVRSLPAPEWEVDSEEAFVEPATELEQSVARVWMDVLGRSEPLSAHADFFAAGGTSLQVFRVTAGLQKATGLEGLPPSLIHTSRTVRATAAALQSLLDSRDSGTYHGLPRIVARHWGDSLRPLSSNQEQMWVLAQNGGSVAYNMPFILELDGIPDVGALQQSLNEIARRHEVLRMHYFDVDGVPMGKIADAEGFHVPFEEARFGNPSELEDALADEGRKEFDFFVGPLIRAKLLSLVGSGGCVLALTLHHAVGDGWSSGILWRELSLLYEAYSLGKAPALEALPIQYADYSAWQQALLGCELALKAEEYWRDALTGAPTLLQLPTDFARPQVPSFRAGTLSMSMPSNLLSQIESCARRLGINAQAILLAAVQLVLMQYSRQDDLVVGVPVAGRDQPSTQGLVGYFINTLPVRATIHDGVAFMELAKRASKAVVESLEHSFLPLARIVHAAGVERTPNVNPLFQVLFQYLPRDQNLGSELKLGSVAGRTVASRGGQAQAKMDMIITLSESGRLIIEYMAELFSPSTVRRLMDNLILCLQHVTTAPNTKASDIHVLCDNDLTLLRSFATPELRAGTLSCPLIHHAFEGIAAAHPGRPCLQFGDAVMSYGEVNEAANRVANRLISLGVGLGSVVGIMLERSFELVISILGALKSGGEFVVAADASEHA